MEAAFVEIGLEKNGFLFVDEIVGPELEGRRPRGRRITDLISRGEEVLVQAVKDPMKTKGARLTTEISLPGRFVVFVPHGEGLGVSRRLEEDERNRLRDIVKEIAPKQGGVIVRTAAEGASAEDVRLDLEFLMKLWKQIQAQAKESTGAERSSSRRPSCRCASRATCSPATSSRRWSTTTSTLKRIQGYLKKTSPHMAERVSRYRDKLPLFEAYGVDAEIRSTLSRRVDLPSGGYLIFDYAEAFTVIDVNTGRFVGSRSKSSGARLEDTVTKNNLEAVKEVVRQLRLRDIGGIIVIDFIDMANPKNREAVEQALQQELERDRTKTYVVEISPLGLVEMTRQNVTDGPREILTRKCPTCAGEGVVVSEATAVVDAERQAARAGRVEAAHEGVQGRAERARRRAPRSGPGAARLEEIEAATRRRFFVDREGAASPHEHFAVLDEGTVEKLAPADSPVEEGQTIELKLVEVGRHDAGAGGREGRRDCRRRRRRGEARRQEGVRADRARARRNRVRDARRRRGRGGGIRADHRRGPGREADARLAGEEARSPETEASSPKLEPRPTRTSRAVAEEDESTRQRASRPRRAPKKKTRRGSRGGRGRKKKPAVAVERARSLGDAEAEAPEPAAEVASTTTERCAAEEEDPPRLARRPWPQEARPPRPRDERAAGDDGRRSRRRPTIHVPRPRREDDAENGDEPGAAPRKKTRRGSRGGRRRRKPGTGTAATAEAPPVRRELGPRTAPRCAARPSRSSLRAPTRRTAPGSAPASCRPPRRPELAVGAVADEDALRRGDAEQLRHPLVEPGVGLHHPLVGREEHSVEVRLEERSRPTAPDSSLLAF